MAQCEENKLKAKTNIQIITKIFKHMCIKSTKTNQSSCSNNTTLKNHLQKSISTSGCNPKKSPNKLP